MLFLSFKEVKLVLKIELEVESMEECKGEAKKKREERKSGEEEKKKGSTDRV